jgi:hypothetical protein
MPYRHRETLGDLQALSPNVTRFELPDGVVWKKFIRGEAPRLEQNHLLNEIADADHLIKTYMRWVKGFATVVGGSIAVLLGVNFLADSLPPSLVIIVDWLFIPLFIAGIMLGGVAFITEKESNSQSPWEKKRKVEREYQEWLMRDE